MFRSKKSKLYVKNIASEYLPKSLYLTSFSHVAKYIRLLLYGVVCIRKYTYMFCTWKKYDNICIIVSSYKIYDNIRMIW